MIALAITGGEACASIGEVFGFGSRGTALNAYAAVADDWAATWYNPAGMSALDRPRTAFGFTRFVSNLSIKGARQEIVDPFGLFIGASAPVPFGGFLKDRLWVGIGMYLPWLDLVKAISRAPDEAFFPLYDNRTQRYTVLPGLSVRILKGLSIGASINYLARLDGTVISHEGDTRAIEADVNEHLAAIASPIVGIRWDPLPDLGTALVYRGEFSIPFKTSTTNQVAGNLLILDIDSVALYSPAQITAGASYRPLPDLLATLDFTWKFWSRYVGPFIKVNVSMPEVLGTIAPEPPKVPFNDTFTLAAGAEYRFTQVPGHLFFARGGLGIEPSPVPDQAGVTNLVDGFKTMLSLGGGWEAGIGEGRKIGADLHCQAHFVASRTLKKAVGSIPDEDMVTPGFQTKNPGYPELSGGGSVVTFGAGVSLTY